MPELVVVHRPPEPTAMYQVLRLVGCMAMSAMRPPMTAGPTSRRVKPDAARAIVA